MKRGLFILTAIMLAGPIQASWQSRVQRAAETSELGAEECAEKLYQDGLIAYAQRDFQVTTNLWAAGGAIAQEHRKLRASREKLSRYHPELKSRRIPAKKVKAICAADREMEGRAHCGMGEPRILGAYRKHVPSQSEDIHQLLEDALESYADQDFQTAAIDFAHIEKIDPTFTAATEYRKKCLEKLKQQHESGMGR